MNKPLLRCAGTFVRWSFVDQVDLALHHPSPSRPAALFNRQGESALYLSPDELSARVAIGQYVKADDPPRVLVTYDIDACVLLDLRHPAAADLHQLASQPWQSALVQGQIPPSWIAADRIRAHPDAVGMIDPSRRRPGLWHITLFRWNQPGAPRVTLRHVAPATAFPVGFR